MASASGCSGSAGSAGSASSTSSTDSVYDQLYHALQTSKTRCLSYGINDEHSDVVCGLIEFICTENPSISKPLLNAIVCKDIVGAYFLEIEKNKHEAGLHKPKPSEISGTKLSSTFLFQHRQSVKDNIVDMLLRIGCLIGVGKIGYLATWNEFCKTVKNEIYQLTSIKTPLFYYNILHVLGVKLTDEILFRYLIVAFVTRRRSLVVLTKKCWESYAHVLQNIETVIPELEHTMQIKILKNLLNHDGHLLEGCSTHRLSTIIRSLDQSTLTRVFQSHTSLLPINSIFVFRKKPDKNKVSASELLLPIPWSMPATEIHSRLFFPQHNLKPDTIFRYRWD